MPEGFSNNSDFDFSKIRILSLGAARNYFLKYFNANKKEKFAIDALNLYREVERLNPKDFFELMKQLICVSSNLNNLRSAIYSLSDNKNLTDVNSTIRTILVKDFTGKDDLNKKIQSIIFITRLAFPFGINMKNPNIEKMHAGNIGDFSFSASEYLSISLPSKNNNPIKIIINPANNLTTINTNNRYSKESEISNGQGILIGREMQVSSVLGHNLKDIVIRTHLSFDLSKQNDKDYKHQFLTFSRAGILLVRLKDRLFLFNRGCTNTIEIKNLKRNEILTFSPDAVGFDDDALVA